MRSSRRRGLRSSGQKAMENDQDRGEREEAEAEQKQVSGEDASDDSNDEPETASEASETKEAEDLEDQEEEEEDANKEKKERVVFTSDSDDKSDDEDDEDAESAGGDSEDVGATRKADSTKGKDGIDSQNEAVEEQADSDAETPDPEPEALDLVERDEEEEKASNGNDNMDISEDGNADEEEETATTQGIFLHCNLTKQQLEATKDVFSKELMPGDAKPTSSHISRLLQICDHPDLPDPPREDIENGTFFIEKSGKLTVLHKILKHLHERGQRVVIIAASRMIESLKRSLMHQRRGLRLIKHIMEEDKKWETIEKFNELTTQDYEKCFIFLMEEEEFHNKELLDSIEANVAILYNPVISGLSATGKFKKIVLSSKSSIEEVYLKFLYQRSQENESHQKDITPEKMNDQEIKDVLKHTADYLRELIKSKDEATDTGQTSDTGQVSTAIELLMEPCGTEDNEDDQLGMLRLSSSSFQDFLLDPKIVTNKKEQANDVCPQSDDTGGQTEEETEEPEEPVDVQNTEEQETDCAVPQQSDIEEEHPEEEEETDIVVAPQSDSAQEQPKVLMDAQNTGEQETEGILPEQTDPAEEQSEDGLEQEEPGQRKRKRSLSSDQEPHKRKDDTQRSPKRRGDVEEAEPLEKPIMESTEEQHSDVVETMQEDEKAESDQSEEDTKQGELFSKLFSLKGILYRFGVRGGAFHEIADLAFASLSDFGETELPSYSSKEDLPEQLESLALSILDAGDAPSQQDWQRLIHRFGVLELIRLKMADVENNTDEEQLMPAIEDGLLTEYSRCKDPDWDASTDTKLLSLILEKGYDFWEWYPFEAELGRLTPTKVENRVEVISAALIAEDLIAKLRRVELQDDVNQYRNFSTELSKLHEQKNTTAESIKELETQVSQTVKDIVGSVGEQTQENLDKVRVTDEAVVAAQDKLHYCFQAMNTILARDILREGMERLSFSADFEQKLQTIRDLEQLMTNLRQVEESSQKAFFGVAEEFCKQSFA